MVTNVGDVGKYSEDITVRLMLVSQFADIVGWIYKGCLG